MSRSRPLALALLLSAVAHVLWLGDIEWRWPWQDAPNEAEVLKRSAPTAVKRVKLALKPVSTRSGITQVYLLPPSLPVPHPGSTSPAERPAPKSPTHAVASTTAAIPEAPATPAPPAPSGSPAEPAAAPPVVEPAPSFPVSVQAIQQATYMGFNLRLEQQWLMEGLRYVIRNEASKFGFRASIVSEGTLSAEDGLQPEHYELRLNKTLKHYADFDRDQGLLIHGKAGDRKVTPLVDDFQDMASLPFHVAVTYEGQARRQLKVTSGSSVYDITLELVASEQLELPGGRLETLHLKGRRVRLDGSLPPQEGYDIWLAPSLRNFPVRFSGPDSKGNFLEMSVLSLRFDGKPVFGRNLPVSRPDSEDEGIVPEALLRQHGLSEPAPAMPAPVLEPLPSP